MSSNVLQKVPLCFYTTVRLQKRVLGGHYITKVIATVCSELVILFHLIGLQLPTVRCHLQTNFKTGSTYKLDRAKSVTSLNKVKVVIVSNLSVIIWRLISGNQKFVLNLESLDVSAVFSKLKFTFNRNPHELLTFKVHADAHGFEKEI